MESRCVLTHSQEGLERQVIDQAAALTLEISDHRGTEMALRESEEYTRLALSAVNGIGTYDWDIVTGQVSGNASFARIFDMDPALAAAGTPQADYLINVAADARVKMQLEYERAMRIGGDCSVVHPVHHPDGSVR
jgi:PAS domain-containing protein